MPVLTTDAKLATAGYYQLSWQPEITAASNKNPHFELQQSPDETFQLVKIVYRGPDQASVISGQTDGDYYYRVRKIYSDATYGKWSTPVHVKVQHHSMQKALLFFTSGAIVFLMILSFIVFSTRNRDGT